MSFGYLSRHDTISENPRCNKCKEKSNCNLVELFCILYKSLSCYFIRAEISRFAEICSRFEEIIEIREDLL